MAQAARTYARASSAAPRRASQPAHRPERRPDIRVIRGQGQAQQTLSPVLVNGFKFAMVAVVFLLAICAVRVWISASTVQTLQSVESLQGMIEKAYASGSELEIEHSTLASPVRIQTQAKQLGMASPEKKIYLKVRMAPEIVKNENGTVSLAGCVENIKNSNAVKKK